MLLVKSFVCLAPSPCRIEEEFCLVEPVQTLVPGHVHYQETDDHKMLPIPISHVGAEEHFRQLVRERECGRGSVKDGLFDKILLHDGCRYLTQPATLFSDMARCLAPGGILLIVHRPAHLSTLPFFKDAQQRLVHTQTHMQTCTFAYKAVEINSCTHFLCTGYFPVHGQSCSVWLYIIHSSLYRRYKFSVSKYKVNKINILCCTMQGSHVNKTVHLQVGVGGKTAQLLYIEITHTIIYMLWDHKAMHKSKKTFSLHHQN